MKNNQMIELKAKIAFFKIKKENDFAVLKHQYYITINSFKPLNLIKSATQEFISSSDLKSNLINGAIGFGTNYLSKNLWNPNSINPIKRVLGKVMQFAFKKFIGKNTRISSDID